MIQSRANTRTLLLFAVAALFLAGYASRAARTVNLEGTIAPAGQMLSPRAGQSATLLLDGRVLIAGGLVKNGEFLKTTELFDPVRGTFSPSGEMSVARVGLAAVRLNDGQVLMVGGWAGSAPTDCADLYDPRTGKFKALASMTSPRARPTATLLTDGRVLVAGGGSSDREGLRSAEIFDPRTYRFTPTGPMSVGRIAHTANLLADGKVLVVGGMDQAHVTTSADLYDPVSGRFTSVGSMKNARYKHTAGILPDGRILIAGGSDDRDGRGTLSTTEVYDPKRGKFSDGPQMTNARYKLPEQAALLRNGELLVAGGNANGELFDEKENTFHEARGGTSQPQWYLSETLLADGDVLLAGGYSTTYQASSQVWLYRAN